MDNFLELFLPVGQSILISFESGGSLKLTCNQSDFSFEALPALDPLTVGDPSNGR